MTDDTTTFPTTTDAVVAHPKRRRRLNRGQQLQRDLFVAEVFDCAPRDDLASMEHPLFALRAGDRRVREYQRGGVTITIKPGHDGCATIHDKDLWIYCISQLVEAKDRGEEIQPVVRFRASDFLKATNRGVSGRDYERMGAMLARLKATVVETNIETNGQRERGGFGLIDSWHIAERDGDQRMVAVEVTLPRWLYRSVEALQVLTLSRDYFGLRRPLHRRIYELARKHCGGQSRWRVKMAVLHVKSGSADKLFKFRAAVKALVNTGGLPDYLMAYDTEADAVTFYAQGPKGRQAEARDFSAGKPAASLEAHQKALKAS